MGTLFVERAGRSDRNGGAAELGALLVEASPREAAREHSSLEEQR